MLLPRKTSIGSGKRAAAFTKVSRLMGLIDPLYRLIGCDGALFSTRLPKLPETDVFHISFGQPPVLSPPHFLSFLFPTFGAILRIWRLTRVTSNGMLINQVALHSQLVRCRRMAAYLDKFTLEAQSSY